jgi:2'-5' RNA ligase
MRLFTAIELPESVRETLVQCQNALRRTIDQRISWTRPENLHATLKFIGEVDDALSAQIIDALKTIAARDAVKASINGLILLPPRGPTRIVGAAISDAGGTLEAVFLQIESALEPYGIARERRRFHPHVTLGRVRERVRIKVEVTELPWLREITIPVSEFVLMQSLGSPAGSSYKVLERYPLARDVSI